MLPGVTAQHLMYGMIATSVVVMVGTSWALYDTDVKLPKPEPLPAEGKDNPINTLSQNSSYFTGLVTEDAKKYKLEGVTVATLKKANPLFTEFSGDQVLTRKAPLETDHLKLQVLNKHVAVGEEGNQIRMPHVILSITNKTEKHLAYKVLTTVEGECGKKGILAHNGIVLKPSEEIKRTECMPRKDAKLHVKKVSVLEVSSLGYYYLSRLDPQNLQYEARTFEGHLQNPHFNQCKIPVPWRRIKSALARGAKWYDVVDFYSRHTCDQYSFFPEYRWSPKGPETLPVAQ